MPTTPASPVRSARRAPVNGAPYGTISWDEHELAWVPYAAYFGNDQDAERIAARGGFGIGELVAQLGHLPTTWQPTTATRFLDGVTGKPAPADDLRARTRQLVELAVNSAYGTDPRHGLIAIAVADAVADGADRLPLALGRHFGRA